MNRSPLPPFYIIPKEHPLINQYRGWFEQIKQNPAQDLRIVIQHEYLKQNIVRPFQDLLLVAQHYPDLLEHLVFALEFSFEKPGTSKERYEGHDWKGQQAIQWFFRLGNGCPAAVFFINDNDARLFSLMGDLIAQGKIITAPVKEETGRLFMNNEQMNILSQRLFQSACSFVQLCDGSGFNPEKYIDSIIADYGLQFTYNDVREEYLKRFPSCN